MQTQNIPDTRLRSAVPYLKKGGRVADIGTDHAYLPIYLVEQGVSARAIACDINQGPIESARKNIAATGLSDRIETLCTDGLCGVENFAPDDVMIFGMGGELIARILSDAPWTKAPSIRLILQPMTHAEILRRFLLREGYSIVDEVLVKDEKIYQIICAEYSGMPQRKPYSELELLCGREPLRRRDALCDELFAHWSSVLSARVAGKQKAGSDTSEEDTLLKQIGEYTK